MQTIARILKYITYFSEIFKFYIDTLKELIVHSPASKYSLIGVLIHESILSKNKIFKYISIIK